MATKKQRRAPLKDPDLVRAREPRFTEGPEDSERKREPKQARKQRVVVDAPETPLAARIPKKKRESIKAAKIVKDEKKAKKAAIKQIDQNIKDILKESKKALFARAKTPDERFEAKEAFAELKAASKLDLSKPEDMQAAMDIVDETADRRAGRPPKRQKPTVQPSSPITRMHVGTPSVSTPSAPSEDGDGMLDRLVSFLADSTMSENSVRFASGMVMLYLGYNNAMKIRLWVVNFTSYLSPGSTDVAVPAWMKVASWFGGGVIGGLTTRAVSSALGDKSFATIFKEYNDEMEKWATKSRRYDEAWQAQLDVIERTGNDIRARVADADALRMVQMNSMPLYSGPEPPAKMTDEQFRVYTKHVFAIRQWRLQLRVLEDALKRERDLERAHAGVRAAHVASKEPNRPKQPQLPPILVPSMNEKITYAWMAFMLGYYPELIPEMAKGLGSIIQGIGGIVPG